jgi:hypothetical protein
MPQLDFAGITHAAPVHQEQAQAVSDDGMEGIPVLDMKKISPLAEHLALVVLLNPESLLQVDLANPLQQQVMHGLIDRVSGHRISTHE